jgi:hypothetical protein
MKTYAIRKKLRTPLRCQFHYFCDGTLANGMIWDLSEAGWRATGERPIPVGTETTVHLTLSVGKRSRNIMIDGAIVRWAKGRDTGWEITKIGDTAKSQLIDFVEHVNPMKLNRYKQEEPQWYYTPGRD